MRPPGVNYEALGQVDVVTISHNHYDHLDENSIKALIKDFDPTFIVPLGVAQIIHKWGSTKVRRLDWWDEFNNDEVFITAVPANHFSGRGAFDRDQTLWVGYVIEVDGHKI
jgi:L-ascorbate metabolism protein UlaG (beta-lactamase superfamily)